MYVMTSEFGAPSQLEKIDMIDYADLIVINKYERKGSEDAKNQVQKQYQRAVRFLIKIHLKCQYMERSLPQFNDPGTNALFAALIEKLNEKSGTDWSTAFSKERMFTSKMS